MKEFILSLFKKVGAWNKTERKAIVYHPISLLFIAIFVIPLFIILLFIDENIIDAFKDNFTFKIN